MAKTWIVDLIKSLPAATPNAGSVYQAFIAQRSSEEVVSLLKDIRESQILTDIEIQEISAKTEWTTQWIETLVSLLKEMALKGAGINLQMVVVIPTAGTSKSLAPITSLIPKCLIPIGSRPMLHHILDSFTAYKSIFKKVIVLTNGCFSRAIEESVNQARYSDFVQCIPAPERLPAALIAIENEISKTPFLIHYSDVLIDKVDWVDVQEQYSRQHDRHEIIGMLLCCKHYPMEIGIVKDREGEQELMHSFAEKPPRLPDGYANTGVSIFEQAFVKYMKPTHKSIFEQPLKKATENRNVGLYLVNRWHHLSTIRDYYHIQKTEFARK